MSERSELAKQTDAEWLRNEVTWEDVFADEVGPEVVNRLRRIAAKLDRIDAAIDCAVQYGGTDEAHHKAWVIDQMVRFLSGDEYEAVVAKAKAGEDGDNTYDWDEGIAP